MCYGRYKKLVLRNKCIWRDRHNERLKQLVSEMGEDWKTIEKHFKSTPCIIQSGMLDR